MINYSEDQWARSEMLSLNVVEKVLSVASVRFFPTSECFLIGTPQEVKSGNREYASLLLCNLTQDEIACRLFLQVWSSGLVRLAVLLSCFCLMFTYHVCVCVCPCVYVLCLVFVCM